MVVQLLATSAIIADSLTPQERGKGTVMIGAVSGWGTGGPGVGLLVTIPLMIASLSGGYLYYYAPASPWIFVLITTLVAIVLTALSIRDSSEAEL